jgi:stage V sporulation protein B
MWALAQPISLLLYGTKAAGPSIANLSPSVFFLGMHQVSTGILQGVGMTVTPMINMFISAAVKVLLVWKLTEIPSWNIIGAAWASNINFAVAAGLNIFFLARYTSFSFPVLPLVKITVAAAVMGIVTKIGYQRMLIMFPSNIICAILAIALAVIIYAGILLLLGEFSEAELVKIPLIGEKLVNILKFMKVLRRKA